MSTLSVYEANCLNLIAGCRHCTDKARTLIDTLVGDAQVIGELIVDPEYPISPRQYFDMPATVAGLKETANTIRELINPSGYQKYEVVVNYQGHSTYIVNATSQGQAEMTARDRFAAGMASDSPSSDEEEIQGTFVREFPEHHANPRPEANA